MSESYCIAPGGEASGSGAPCGEEWMLCSITDLPILDLRKDGGCDDYQHDDYGGHTKTR
jgi:hypothetical protein